jgi:hypothetical protein
MASGREIETGLQRRSQLRAGDQRRQLSAGMALNVRNQRRDPQLVEHRRTRVDRDRHVNRAGFAGGSNS